MLAGADRRSRASPARSFPFRAARGAGIYEEIADGWTLENRVARQWVTLPGYHGDAKTICEWHAAQALHNPYGPKPAATSPSAAWDSRSVSGAKNFVRQVHEIGRFC